jgi:hypothetical protein
MVVRHLGMLGSIRHIAIFVGFCGTPVRFRGFVVMFGCFVMIVFRHCGYFRAF